MVVEGQAKMGGEWKEYEFPHKPGKLDRMPPIIGTLKWLGIFCSFIIFDIKFYYSLLFFYIFYIMFYF